MTDIPSLASEAYGWFETATRTDSDESYMRTRDGSPDWLDDIVRNAHGELLPDDWRYETIRNALSAIAESDGEDLDDLAHEFADGEADVYTSQLLAWLASHSSRVGYVDDARDEFGADQDAGILSDIQRGQYAEALEVFGLVAEGLREHAETLALDES